MKKQSISFFTFLLALVMSTAACKNAETKSPAESVGGEAVESAKEDQLTDGKKIWTIGADFAVDEEKSETEEEPGAENEDETGAETADERSAETAEEMMKAAYISVLENICFEHILPPPIRDELGFDEMFDPADNKFAVYDIDQDGRNELIIVYTTAAAYSGMKELIYGFDADTGTVREEFSEFPSVTFYDNGIVEASWSHNHGNAADRDDFWPYNVYRYDPETDTYMLEALVDAWSVDFAEKDSAGNPFPKEADLDGDGMVYRITAYKLNEPVDGEEYRKWREECIAEAELIKIPFLSITEENIYTWNDEGE